MTALMLYYHSILACTCGDGIRASGICYLYRFNFWCDWMYRYSFICLSAGGDISASAICHLWKFIMSHSLLWRHIVLLTVGVCSSNHRVLYTIGIRMTRRFQKSVGPSVSLSVCNANKKKPTPPSLLTVEK